MKKQHQKEKSLVCFVCGVTSSGRAWHWRAYLGHPSENNDRTQTYIYCPACAAVEFGEE